MPVSEWTDLGCVWTHKSHARFRDAFPGRYLALQLRSFDTTFPSTQGDVRAAFVNINTHSKLRIVDDRFLAVGSANFNHRGMVYDTEAAVVVLNTTWVREARRRVLGNMLGPTIPLSDDSGKWFQKLKDVASVNDAVRAAWAAQGDKAKLSGGALPRHLRPLGFLYSLDFRDKSKCLFESVGPDMT
jgi:phosphatidylserine/phosphatidylglycerophosphate/cardiolipin synthase-like enzyme